MLMARTWVNRVIALASLGLATIPLAACKSVMCSTPAPDIPVVLRVEHLSGGTAPVVYSLTIYEDRSITASAVGLTPLCGKCQSSGLAKVRRILGSAGMSDLVARRHSLSRRCGGDIEQVSVSIPGPPVQLSFCVALPLSADEAVLAELFHAMDSMFSRAFRYKYPPQLLSPEDAP